MSPSPEAPQIPQPLLRNLIRMLRTPEAIDTNFEILAIEVFKFQFTHNIPYQNYCITHGRNPENINHWHEIPRVSTDAFKVISHPLITHSPASTLRTFHTSGTTGEIRGQHHFPSLELYKQAILSSWQRLSLAQPTTLVFLTPHPEHAPHSSLSYMMGVLAEHYAEAQIIWAISEDGTLDLDKIEPLAELTSPVAILGTAITFLHLFDSISIPLPSGSFAMETGGYKGTKRQLEKAELYALFSEKLGLKPDCVINEYSMTELSSQFYTRGLNQPHTAHSWTRTRVIDPRTGTDAAAGESGHLAIYDLANLYSVSAIQTQDIAIAGEDNSFTLLGRDPTALPRGCSRSADQALG